MPRVEGDAMTTEAERAVIEAARAAHLLDAFVRDVTRDTPEMRQAVAQLRAENAALATSLRECADRFERCCVASGSDPEYAAIAVEKYRTQLSAIEEPKT